MSDKKDNVTVKVAVPTIPVFGLLGVVFVTLKLLGHITWSWWWVTAPFWAPLAVFLTLATAFLLAVGGFILLCNMVNDKKYKS
jgi:hypothetical protein